MFVLRFEEGSDLGVLDRKYDQPAPHTEVMESSIATKWPKGTSQAVVELEEKRVACLKAHQDMLGTLYHVTPAFCETAITNNYLGKKSSITMLLGVASIYDCENVVKLHVDSYLRFHRKEVLSICYIDPASMLELAIAVKSDWMFTDAAANLLGSDKDSYQQAGQLLTNLKIADLLNKKRTQFEEKLKGCELDLFRIQPRKCTAWESIAALGYFRQWLSEQLNKGYGSGMSPRYATLYRMIQRGRFMDSSHECRRSAVAYMSNAVRTTKANDTPTFEVELGLVLSQATKVVQPLLEDVTERRDQVKYEYHPLTFLEIRNDELPWKNS